MVQIRVWARSGTKSLIAFLMFLSIANAEMRKMWELRLSDTIREPSGWSIDRHHSVEAISFSHDGQRLAVTMDSEHLCKGGAPPCGTHLLVFDLASPKASLRQYDLEKPFWGNSIEWSPFGDAIRLSGGIVMQLNDGQILAKGCNTNLNNSGFIDGHHLIVQKQESNQLMVQNITDCQAIDSWTIDSELYLNKTETLRGLIMLGNRNEVQLVEAKSHKPMPGWSSRKVSVSISYFRTAFLDSGKAICMATYDKKHPVTCWDIDTAEIIKTASLISGTPYGAKLFAAANAPFLVTEHWLEMPLIIVDSSVPLSGHGMIWDIRTGKKVASWNRKKQTYGGSPGGAPEPYAISPDGHYIAEGGNGVIRLYRVD